MKFTTILIAALLFAFSAHAGGKHHHHGKAAASGDTSISHKTDAEPAQAATVNLTSSNCIGSAGIGGGAALFSFTLGWTREYENCLKNEVAKTLISMGEEAAAKKVLMSIDYIGKALDDEVATIRVAYREPGAVE